MKIKIEVLSQNLFDNTCKNKGLNDANVDLENELAFISIIGTEECLKYYLKEPDTTHYFKTEHKNVLNLEFDDCSTDVLYNDHLFKTISIEQAEKIVDFIEEQIKNGVNNFLIHCRAGVSRSRAVAEAICRLVSHEHEIDYPERYNFYNSLNHYVLRKISHAYYKKHKIYGYENGEDYPQDLITPEIKIFNRKNN